MKAPSFIALAILATLPSTGCIETELTSPEPVVVVEPDLQDRDMLPFETTDDAWVFVEDETIRCMDGSTSGFGIRVKPGSDKLLFKFQEGGACFNEINCKNVVNPNGFDANTFAASREPNEGLFNNSNQNPFSDYTQVFVPYCSGDAFVGDTQQGAQGFTQQGARNVRQIMQRVEAQIGDSIEHVVLSGSSAGGLGTLFNYGSAKEVFGPKTRGLIADSSLVLNNEGLTSCLEEKFLSTWNTAEHLESSCPDCSTEKGGLSSIYRTLSRTYPDDLFTLIGSFDDTVFKLFYSFGIPCESIDRLDFRGGVVSLESELASYPNVETLLFDSDRHVYLHGSRWSDLRFEVQSALEQFDQTISARGEYTFTQL